MICGRFPGDCCADCHAVHDRLWREVYDPERPDYKSKRVYPERPNCDCHGETMWSQGEYWTCRIRDLAKLG